MVTEFDQKLRKGEQPFLNATHHLDLMLIPINSHKDILSGYKFMGSTIIVGKNN